jgi:cytochrome c-type biogenesis protein CcmH
MLVWVALAVMTGVAVLAVLAPLARRDAAGTAPDMRSTDRAFYEAQLAEIERDKERGLLEASEAATARVEAARRLLAADRLEQKAGEVAPSGMRRRVAAGLALIGIPLMSLGLYLSVGHPELPAQPLAERTDGVNQAGGMDEAIAKIEQHLAANPNDGRGFEVVAPVYMSMGRFTDAAKAYANAMRLLGVTPTRLENYAEALIAEADGVATPAAREAYTRALAQEPKLGKARFFKAMAAEQDGDRVTAVALYRELAAEAPPGSPVAAMLDERLAALGQAPTSGPSSAAGQAIAAMPKGDQLSAIRGMVENLSAKLETNGADVEGWLRLVRSYMVLNEPDKARAALERGRTALAGDPQGKARLEALGRELAIGGS